MSNPTEQGEQTTAQQTEQIGQTGQIGLRHFHYNEVPTTQDLALEIFTKEASQGRTEPILVTSDKMTNGRGRIGKKWVADQSGNLNMSLSFNHLSFAVLTVIPIAIATSVGEALGLTNLEGFKYKWPNDLLIDGKKAGGILIEINNNIFTIGIGVNLTNAPSVDDTATTSLSAHQHQHRPSLSPSEDNNPSQTGQSQQGEQQAAQIAHKVAQQILFNLGQIAANPQASNKHLEAWRRNCWKKEGDQIEVKMPDGQKRPFIFIGLNEDGTMKAKAIHPTGVQEEGIINLSYGDVS